MTMPSVLKLLLWRVDIRQVRASYLFIYPDARGAIIGSDGTPLLTLTSDPRCGNPGWVLSHDPTLPERLVGDRFIGGGRGDLDWVLQQVRRHLQRRFVGVAERANSGRSVTTTEAA